MGYAEKFGLAMIATGGVVDQIGRIADLCAFAPEMFDAQFMRETGRVLFFRAGQTRAYRCQRQELPAVSASLLLCRPEQKRAVHAAGKSDDEAARQFLTQNLAKGRVFRR